MQRVTQLLAAAAVLCSVSACTVDSNPSPVVTVAPTSPPATLVVQWSIDESTDPNRCVATSSDAIQITVFDPSGQDVGTFEQTCQAFSTSITLGAGPYSATAILLDGGNQPRTTPVDIAPFTLIGSDQFVVTVDFPSSSFLE